MYRAILVDNEIAIRKGIRDHIAWESLDIEIAGEAADGQSALRLVEELSPEILITDIKMPYMDGLELSELAKLSRPDLKVVLVSGYDDFKYAKRGIQLGVDGYVLKPVDKEELETLLRKITAEIRESGQKTEENGREPQNPVIGSLLLDKLFRGIIYGKQRRDEVLSRQRELLGTEEFSFVCMMAQMDNYLSIIQDMTEEEQQAYSRQFYETIEVFTDNIGGLVGFATEDYSYLFFLFDRSGEALEERVRRICPQLKQILMNADMSISIGIGQICPDAGGLQTSYRQARYALNYKFVSGLNSTNYYANVESLDESPDVLQKNLSNHVISALQLCDKEGLSGVLAQAEVELIAGGHKSQTYMGLFIGVVFRRTVTYLEEIGITVDEIFEKPIDEYSRIIGTQTLKEAMDALYLFLSRVIDFVVGKKQGKLGHYIDFAKKYIEEHYSESDINLTQIAGQIQMSVSYFSLEFKRNVGRTYIEFLTDLRIRRAKQLLRSTSIKVSEIANMVGYENSTYFNYLFKQYTGITPGQFRKAEAEP